MRKVRHSNETNLCLDSVSSRSIQTIHIIVNIIFNIYACQHYIGNIRILIAWSLKGLLRTIILRILNIVNNARTLLHIRLIKISIYIDLRILMGKISLIF